MRPIRAAAATFWSLALCVLLALPALAQEEETAWQRLANRAEQVIGADGSSIEVLEALRGQIAERRAEFLSAQDTNAARIRTLEDQLDALGPAPEDGEAAEDPDIRQRRDRLESQLEDLRAPVIEAEEAYTRANGLVAEIDGAIREAAARKLLARQPSPLLPAAWRGAADAVTSATQALILDLEAAWTDVTLRSETLQSLAIAAPLAALGLLLIVRSGWWIDLILRWLTTNALRGRGVVSFAVSLGQILLPALGVTLFAAGLKLPGFSGLAVETSLNGLLLILLPVIVGRWLSHRIVSAEIDRPGLISLDQQALSALQFYGVAIGLCVGFLMAIEVLASISQPDEAALSALKYVPRFLLGILLIRMGGILMNSGEPDGGFGIGILRLLGRLVIVAATLGVFLASAGYSNAAEILLIPSAETLALAGIILLLQRLVYDVYSLVTGIPEGEADGLVPVLIAFGLALLSLPVFALIWGARTSDLTEVWSRFVTGFRIGDTRISPADFLTFLLVFAALYGFTRLVQRALRNTVLPRTSLDVGGRNAIVSGFGYVGVITAIIVSITSAGIDLSSLAIVAGALSVGIGFGLQNVVSNFVAGIILLIERPISEGDWIEVGGQMGYVRSISVRSTRIETFDRTDVIIPNADLVSNSVTNWTHGNLVGRVIVPVTVALDSDTKLVEKLLYEAAESHSIVTLNPAPQILFRGIAPEGLTFEIRAILRDVNWVLDVQSDLNHEVMTRFREAGIVIPVPQRAVWMREGALPDGVDGRDGRDGDQ